MRHSLLVTMWVIALICASHWHVAAADVYLPSGYAKIWGYEGTWDGYSGGPYYPSSGTFSGFSNTYWGDMFPTWLSSNTNAISVSVRNRILSQPTSDRPWENCLYFTSGGTATMGQSYASAYTDMRLGGQMYTHVKFEWTTDFGYSDAANYLRLEVPADYYGRPLWSVTPGKGYHHGHVDMDVPYDYPHPISDISFKLSVVDPVPEPSTLTVMASGFSGVCFLIAKRRDRR